VTSEQRAAYIKGLLDERAGYEKRGDTDRVNEVNEQLRRLGHDAETPAKRAERRPAARTRKAAKR
jgi:hypothetical protein